MKTHTEISTLQDHLKKIRLEGQTIGLVPTMGNLHAGHIDLIKEAKSKTDFVVCSIFVNPLQFGANEDLGSYPRTLDQDSEKLTGESCDSLFAPNEIEIYGSNPDNQTIVRVPELSNEFCGKSRPGHFDGVATIVTKLFNIAQPDIAFFGLKDYQQLLVIKKFTADLSMNIDIVGVETRRENSGLAMSSRNNYLNDEQRQSAASIYQCLNKTSDQLRAGNREFSDLEQAAKVNLQQAGLKPDYFSICNASNLQAATADDTQLVILAAAYIGPSRLIDNIQVKLPV
ncbi:MAG: pantoate--beta-alanine ligase [SAR86 cluster bacterium]|uniref:Pantothenate synthetase n=1 Tax=SAR86 cluster bacterium TaxID=2030880 RepID=A0A2A5B2J0_9GAMM|nr:MAG: pantoate--beta-alanine ligase [SAR86 cluster bacterium]